MTRIFAHAVYSVGISEHPERAVLLAGPEDIVCVSAPVDQDFLGFLADLKIGADPARIVVAADHAPEPSARFLTEKLLSSPAALERIGLLVASEGAVELIPHMVTKRELLLAEKLSELIGREVPVLGGDAEIVGFANQKHHMREVALELGVPVPEGEIVGLQEAGDGRPADTCPLSRAIDRRIGRTGKAIIKGARGSGGVATFVVDGRPESKREVLDVVSERDNTIFVVESMVQVRLSPNVLVFVDEAGGDIRCLGITDQLLDGGIVHVGNTYPSRTSRADETLGYCLRVAEWLQARRFSGPLGFDFVECRQGRSEDVTLMAEVNPRVNASLYPLDLMARLNREWVPRGMPQIHAFVSTKIAAMQATSFRQIRAALPESLFDPARGRGMLPTYTASIRNGKLGLICFAASLDEARSDFERIRATLAPGAAGHADRSKENGV
jgi:hypothetical protein